VEALERPTSAQLLPSEKRILQAAKIALNEA